jgi:hypothetical protein
MYEHGEGRQDYAEAIKWYRLAADSGDNAGRNGMGWMYEQGFGVKRDLAEAAQWYGKAADAGDGRGQDNLARVLAAKTSILTGSNDVPVVVAFDQVPLMDAIQVLARQAGLVITFDPVLLNQKAADGTPIPSPIVTIKYKNVTARQVLQSLLDNYGWQMTTNPGPTFRITFKDPNAVRPLWTKVNLLENVETNGAAAAGNEIIPEIAFEGVPLPDAINTLAQESGLNIQFDPRLAESPDVKVTVKYKNVTARQVLQSLLDNYGWQITQIPGLPIFRIASKNP